jgi:hypothetical protein
MVFFRDWRNRELAAYDGNRHLSVNKNAATRKLWWSVPGCNLVTILEHIVAGNRMRLEFSAAAWWAAHRLQSESSSFLSSSSSTV